MTARVRFYFDPICPWCYQTSRWARRLADLGEIELSWGLFSLEIANRGSEESVRKGHGRSGPALRTAQILGEEHGSDAVGDFYAALGRRVHEEGAPLEGHDTVVAALAEAGLAATVLDKALADDASGERVRAAHEAVVARTGAFGVPTLVLDDGEGPAIFGPVISAVPADDAEAVELFRHVAWLARYENFHELKRKRTPLQGLTAHRRH